MGMYNEVIEWKRDEEIELLRHEVMDLCYEARTYAEEMEWDWYNNWDTQTDLRWWVYVGETLENERLWEMQMLDIQHGYLVTWEEEQLAQMQADA